MTVQSMSIGGQPAQAVYLGDLKLWPGGGGGGGIVWGRPVATLGTPVMSGSSPAATFQPMVPEANARMTATADGFTFACDAATQGSTGQSVAVPLTLDLSAVPDDATMIRVQAHVHFTDRPEGALEYAPGQVIPQMNVRPWSDVAASPPVTALGARTINIARLVTGGNPAGQPTDFDLSWIVTKTEAAAWVGGGNPRLLFDMQHGFTMGPVAMPSFALEVSGVAVMAQAVA